MTNQKNEQAAAPWLPMPPVIDNPSAVNHLPSQAQMSPFAEAVSDNPFLAPPAPEADPEPELHVPDENTPEWNKFVGFILQFGDVIQRAEYPSPRGAVVDTIWQGVPVVDGRYARVRHKNAGWIDWDDAIRGTEYE